MYHLMQNLMYTTYPFQIRNVSINENRNRHLTDFEKLYEAANLKYDIGNVIRYVQVLIESINQRINDAIDELKNMSVVKLKSKHRIIRIQCVMTRAA